MALQKDRTAIDDTAESFDVLCVIAATCAGVYGLPAHVAAMTLIGEHDAPGVYTFPMPDGRIQRVTVEYIDGIDPTTER